MIICYSTTNRKPDNLHFRPNATCSYCCKFLFCFFHQCFIQKCKDSIPTNNFRFIVDQLRIKYTNIWDAVLHKSDCWLQVTRPLDTVVARTAAEDSTVPRESESSGDESLVPNNWQSRGRRRSIMRQQSYEEEEPEGEAFVSPSTNSSLSLWATGDLPVRRHSAQDPSRRDDSLEARRTRDSLDVPHNRVHRHHSWDYDVTRDTLPM